MSDMNDKNRDHNGDAQEDVREDVQADVAAQDVQADATPMTADDAAHDAAHDADSDASDDIAPGRERKRAPRKPVSAEKKDSRKRYLRYGGYSILSILLVIVLLVAANIGLQQAESRFALKLDMTANKQYSLSQEAKDYLKAIDKDIELYTVYTNNTPASQDQIVTKETLERIASYNPHIKFGNIDVDREPKLASQFVGEDNSTLARGSVVVSNPANKRFRVLGTYDLLDIGTDQNSGQSYLAGYKIEEGVCNALVYVTSDKLSNLYFLEGHNENGMYSYTDLQTIWQGMNFEAKSLKLLDTQPQQGDVVVVAAPKADCSEAERDILKTFLQNGGRMVYITDADHEALPNFESLLSYYGVGITHELVTEEDSQFFYQQQDVVMSPVTASGDIMGRFPNRSYTMFYRATGLTLPEIPKNTITVTPLIKSSKTSKQITLKGDAASEASTGEAVLALSIEAKNPEGKTELDGKIVVLGSNCIDANFLSIWPYNQYLFTGTMNWMRQSDDSMYIAAKAPASTALAFTSQSQMLLLAALVVILIPVLVISAGVVIWFRRRHL